MQRHDHHLCPSIHSQPFDSCSMACTRLETKLFPAVLWQPFQNWQKPRVTVAHKPPMTPPRTCRDVGICGGVSPYSIVNTPLWSTVTDLQDVSTIMSLCLICRTSDGACACHGPKPNCFILEIFVPQTLTCSSLFLLDNRIWLYLSVLGALFHAIFVKSYFSVTNHLDWNHPAISDMFQTYGGYSGKKKTERMDIY